MNEPLKMPKGFKAYSKLFICSNEINGGGQILSIGKELPLVIGKGAKPQVWLKAIKNWENKEFIQVLESSIPKVNGVKVKSLDNGLVIEVQGIKILHVQDDKEGTAVVSFLDLKPMGLNITGNGNELKIGNNTISNNRMNGKGVLVALS